MEPGLHVSTLYIILERRLTSGIVWTLGPDWPNNGEIDIIEGVNSELVNSMALHT